jgi:hypothetical protein
MRKVLAMTALALLLGACAGASLSHAPPPGFDLSGTWLLNPAYSDAAPVPAPPGGGGRRLLRGGGMAPGSWPDAGPSTGLPGGGGRGGEHMGGPGGPASMRMGAGLLRAERLTIEQDATSMGIRIPGEVLRDVDWGTHEIGALKVDARWDRDGTLVVHSKRSGEELQERYRLSEDHRHLTLEIERSGGPHEPKRIVRYFDRAPAP